MHGETMDFGFFHSNQKLRPICCIYMYIICYVELRYGCEYNDGVCVCVGVQVRCKCDLPIRGKLFRSGDVGGKGEGYKSCLVHCIWIYLFIYYMCIA